MSDRDEKKIASVQRAEIIAIIKDAYHDQYDGSGRRVIEIIEGKYGARLDAVLAQPSSAFETEVSVLAASFFPEEMLENLRKRKKDKKETIEMLSKWAAETSVTRARACVRAVWNAMGRAE